MVLIVSMRGRRPAYNTTETRTQKLQFAMQCWLVVRPYDHRRKGVTPTTFVRRVWPSEVVFCLGDVLRERHVSLFDSLWEKFVN